MVFEERRGKKVSVEPWGNRKKAEDLVLVHEYGKSGKKSGGDPSAVNLKWMEGKNVTEKGKTNRRSAY